MPGELVHPSVWNCQGPVFGLPRSNAYHVFGMPLAISSASGYSPIPPTTTPPTCPSQMVGAARHRILKNLQSALVDYNDTGV